MSKTIRVTAPYVTLKVTDPYNGGVTVRGFYAGAVVEGVEDACAKHHLDNDMAVTVKPDATPEAHPEVSAEVPVTQVELAEPAGNASTEAWVEFAKSKGAAEADLVDAEGNPLGQRALREKYGTPAES